jgi:hypothetical protein
MAIDEYIAHHNLESNPFICTKSARNILQTIIRTNSRLNSKQSETLHYRTTKPHLSALTQRHCGTLATRP